LDRLLRGGGKPPAKVSTKAKNIGGNTDTTVGKRLGVGGNNYDLWNAIR